MAYSTGSYKFYLTIIIIMAFEFFAFGQKKCGFEKFEMANLPKTLVLEDRTKLRIPLVFHIVYRDEKFNFPRAVILEQIQTLNDDFNGKNAQVATLSPEFLELLGVFDVEFYLAEVDSSCIAFQGIQRRKTHIIDLGTYRNNAGKRSIFYTNEGGMDAIIPSKYINIWVAEMESLRGISSGPSMANSLEDGIIIDPRYFGHHSLNDQLYEWGHTLSHEMGHYFGLNHIWGSLANECVEDDGIEDTPISYGPNFFCRNRVATCDRINPMWQNFMDYTQDDCLALFTVGQVNAMKANLSTLRTGLLAWGDCSDPILTKLKIFPNPCRDFIVISLNTRADLTYSLYSISGQRILNGSLADGENYILNMNLLSAGTYILELVDPQGHLPKITQLVVKI